MPFGSKVYYRPSATAEVQKQAKFESKLREGLFFGYAFGNGGSLSPKGYLVLDRDAFCDQRMDHQRRAGVHRVKEIEVPGSRADDSEKRVSFPVAEGLWREYSPELPSVQSPDRSTGTRRDPIDRSAAADELGHLTARDPEQYEPTVNRPTTTGEREGQEVEGEAPAEGPQQAPEQLAGALEPGVVDTRTPKERGEDYWQLQGMYLVRVHVQPRSALFSPLEAPGADKCPIDLKYIDVRRTTETDLDLKGFDQLEDAWSGNSSDAVVLRDPETGARLTWVGATCFSRVMPKPPRGKVWVGDEFFRRRRTSMRPDNITPTAWWLMSTGERLEAVRDWKILSAKIREAKSKRSIPLEPLEAMPSNLVDGWLPFSAKNNGNAVSGGG